MAVQVYNHLSVDLVFDSTIPSIDVMQGDTGRGLIITYLTEIDNLDSATVSAVLKVERPDGVLASAPAEVEKLGADMAQVIVEPTEEYAALIDIAGVCKAVLEITSGDSVISTFRFRIDVKENPFYGTTIGSLTPRQLETVAETVAQYLADHPEVIIAITNRSIHHNKLMSIYSDPGDGGVIGSGAITRDEIASDTIINRHLTNDCVHTAELQNDAVTTAKIKDSAVTNSKIASGVISEDKLSFDPFADLVFLGKKVGGSGETDYGSAINISGYRALLLVAGVSNANRILVSTLIPVGWVTTDGPYSYGSSANNFQAHYNAGGTMYFGCVIFDSATSVRISAGNSSSFAALYGIK